MYDFSFIHSMRKSYAVLTGTHLNRSMMQNAVKHSASVLAVQLPLALLLMPPLVDN
jgi:hypothetical protein